MLEKPAIEEDLILARLRDAYDLPFTDLEFLPWGADQNTAVYRASGGGGEPFFVKLRRGAFDESAVAVPRFLRDLGLREIIAPRPATSGRLWAELGGYRLILYPFVASRDAYEFDMTPRHWREIGATLRRIHDATPPPALLGLVRREMFSDRWRARLGEMMATAAAYTGDDPAAAELAGLLQAKRREIGSLIHHAGRLASELQDRPRPLVLCHSDLHAGNIVLDEAGQLYIVDWDQPILAPRERDLMYPGGAQGFRGNAPEDEERLFYEGYGAIAIDWAVVAYYRFERIVEDLAVFAAEVLLGDEGGADRAQAVRYVQTNFLPGSTIERAYAALAARGAGYQAAA